MTNAQSKPRVFISFDFDHDASLRYLLVGQARNANSPFEIADWSIKEPVSGDWKGRARFRIQRVDKFLVLCGEHTDTASGVSAEIQIAREEGKPVYFLRGHSDRPCRLPKAALPGNRMLDWTRENLAAILGGEADSSETGSMSFRELVLLLGVAGLLYLAWRASERKGPVRSFYRRPWQPPIRWL